MIYILCFCLGLIFGAIGGFIIAMISFSQEVYYPPEHFRGRM